MRGWIVATGIVAAFFCAAAFAQTEIDLWREGFRPIWESGYEDVEECEPDKPVKLSGGLYFECSGYNYVYHYGAVKVMAKAVTYQGRSFQITYLCLDGEKECLEGTLLRLQ